MRAAPVFEVFGVPLAGLTPESGRKLLLSLALIAIVVIARRVLRAGTDAVFGHERLVRVRFWARQIVGIVAAAVLVLGLVSLWFDDPARLTTAAGLVTAGLAFALQKVVTAVAGYVVIMRGKTFGIGDRIVMGGVRGDVIGLAFTQTTIMEMGQPPPVQNADPAMWVRSRQYTGRIVTVSNARVFDEPVFNYTREFPYLWEELTIPIAYTADRGLVERLLLDITERHTAGIQQMSEEAQAELMRRNFLRSADLAPKVYVRLTDNWLELTVRFIALDHGVRDLKDAISREVLTGLEAAHIGLASATFEIVGLPPLRVEGPLPPVRIEGSRG